MYGEQARFDANMDAAQKTAADLIAIAIDYTAHPVSNYHQQVKIADRALDISEAQRRHAQDAYWPHELDFMEDLANPGSRRKHRGHGPELWRQADRHPLQRACPTAG